MASKKQKKKLVKRANKQAAGAAQKPDEKDERTGFGILPDRDLKKNLGCG